jgi:hypothetical protein
MKPRIDSTSFGSVTIEGRTFDHDVMIRQDGTIRKRKKKLSSALYGTSHVISLDEARYVYEDGAERLILGAGQYGQVELSEEAAAYLHERQCQVDLLPMDEALQAWNQAEGVVIGLFHITC